MANLVQYLYEYENGKRIRNIGFMKTEKQMDKSVISLYAKQVDEVKGILFEREDGTKYMAAWEDCAEEATKQEDAVKPTQENCTIDQEDSSYIQPSTLRCEKIQRQGLSRLPRQEWKLANNSFLLHGFYNYHHLLYIEEDGEVWIGVPGIYHEKEEVAAKAFGFPVFRRSIEFEVELRANEQNMAEDFGYWCRQVKASGV